MKKNEKPRAWEIKKLRSNKNSNICFYTAKLTYEHHVVCKLLVDDKPTQHEKIWKYLVMHHLNM